MQSNTLLKQILLIATFAGFVISLWLIFNFISKKPIRGISSSIIKNEAVSPKEAGFELLAPVRLKIPKISVDATIEPVGLAPDGAMDVPKDLANAAWLDLGPRPGESGSAVIAGHYGLKDGKPSVFDDLYKLRKGDKLYIEDDKGTIIAFVVRENRRYAPNADASSVFISNDGKPHLNLITCEGDWNEVTKTYSQRLVVFADKE